MANCFCKFLNVFFFEILKIGRNVSNFGCFCNKIPYRTQEFSGDRINSFTAIISNFFWKWDFEKRKKILKKNETYSEKSTNLFNTKKKTFTNSLLDNFFFFFYLSVIKFLSSFWWHLWRSIQTFGCKFYLIAWSFRTFSEPAKSTRYNLPESFFWFSKFSCFTFMRNTECERELCSFIFVTAMWRFDFPSSMHDLQDLFGSRDKSFSRR